VCHAGTRFASIFSINRATLFACLGRVWDGAFRDTLMLWSDHEQQGHDALRQAHIGSYLLEEIERIQARHNLDLTRVIVSMLRHGLDVYNREVADRAVGPRRRVRAWG
jgi:hypothetical protein